jgi:hypothetical protein
MKTLRWLLGMAIEAVPKAGNSVPLRQAVFSFVKKHRASALLPSNRTMIWAFMALGIALRLRQYLYDRSLWHDETALAINIIHRSWT